jgi:hypothetical protein
MNARLKRRLEALEKNLPPKQRDLRHEIEVRALATALTPEELEMLIDTARDGVVEFPPEVGERVAKALEAITIELTGQSCAGVVGAPYSWKGGQFGRFLGASLKPPNCSRLGRWPQAGTQGPTFLSRSGGKQILPTNSLLAPEHNRTQFPHGRLAQPDHSSVW